MELNRSGRVASFSQEEWDNFRAAVIANNKAVRLTHVFMEAYIQKGLLVMSSDNWLKIPPTETDEARPDFSVDQLSELPSTKNCLPQPPSHQAG